jgi:hypothetical protein
VEDLRGMQSQYNKKNSDFADALRFQMFGSTAIIDGNPDDVSKLNIRPNALHAIRTSEEAMEKDKQASIARQEYNMSNAEAVNKYLDRLGDDMRDTLDMPKLSDLVNIPSAKAIRYLYNDLISRCMDRWSSWRPVIKQIILFIIHASSILKYPDFQSSWSNLTFNINIKPKYPLPDDEDTAKQTAIQEVTAHVRTVASYLKEYGNVEDTKSAFNQILQEIADITNAEGGSLQLGDGNGDSNEGGGDE